MATVVLSPAAAPNSVPDEYGSSRQSAASHRPVQSLHGQFPHMQGEQRPGQLISQITTVITGEYCSLKPRTELSPPRLSCSTHEDGPVTTGHKRWSATTPCPDGALKTGTHRPFPELIYGQVPLFPWSLSAPNQGIPRVNTDSVFRHPPETCVCDSARQKMSEFTAAALKQNIIQIIVNNACCRPPVSAVFMSPLRNRTCAVPAGESAGLPWNATASPGYYGAEVVTP